MNEILDKTKELLFNDENYIIDDICKMWPMTNENLKEVYKLFDVNNKNVLTVTSSSDHIFDAIVAGAKVVDSFDINYLTEYYYHLKKAMIQSYRENTYFNLIEFLSYGVIAKKQYKKIRKNLNGKYQLFWDEIIKYYMDTDTECLKNLYNVEAGAKHFNLVNYLSHKNYKLLKKQLDLFEPKFIHSDIFLLDSKLDKTYDLIYLSNIYEYTDKINYEGLKKVKKYAKTKLYPYLNDGGTIVYAYLYGYSSKHFDNLYTIKDNDEFYYFFDGTYGKKDFVLTLKK